MININLWTINGNKYNVEIERNQNIGEIKKYIKEKIIKEKTNQIKICYRKKILDDDIKINSINILKNEKIIILSPLIKLIQNKKSNKIIQNNNNNNNNMINISNASFETINSCLYKELSITEEYYQEKKSFIQEFVREIEVDRIDLPIEVKIPIPC